MDEPDLVARVHDEPVPDRHGYSYKLRADRDAGFLTLWVGPVRPVEAWEMAMPSDGSACTTLTVELAERLRDQLALAITYLRASPEAVEQMQAVVHEAVRAAAARTESAP